MIQEESISSWIESMDEKKKQIAERDARIDRVEQENESLMTKNGEYRDKFEGMESENKQLQESDLLTKSELQRIIIENEKLLKFLEESKTSYNTDIEDLKR